MTTEKEVLEKAIQELEHSFTAEEIKILKGIAQLVTLGQSTRKFFGFIFGNLVDLGKGVIVIGSIWLAFKSGLKEWLENLLG